MGDVGRLVRRVWVVVRGCVVRRHLRCVGVRVWIRKTAWSIVEVVGKPVLWGRVAKKGLVVRRDVRLRW